MINGIIIPTVRIPQFIRLERAKSTSLIPAEKWHRAMGRTSFEISSVREVVMAINPMFHATALPTASLPITAVINDVSFSHERSNVSLAHDGANNGLLP